MKAILSRVWAEILAIRYDSVAHYHHINKSGYWEFEIKDTLDYDTYPYEDTIYYKTKGLR